MLVRIIIFSVDHFTLQGKHQLVFITASQKCFYQIAYGRRFS